ncbi:uncharacterized protein [Dermacentor albipictus]|uniref:uncharacterized protein n=1 Tax=Dermacentor albipictus TaxID=60249 RepID=UPI0038FC6786
MSSRELPGRFDLRLVAFVAILLASSVASPVAATSAHVTYHVVRVPLVTVRQADAPITAADPPASTTTELTEEYDDDDADVVAGGAGEVDDDDEGAPSSMEDVTSSPTTATSPGTSAAPTRPSLSNAYSPVRVSAAKAETEPPAPTSPSTTTRTTKTTTMTTRRLTTTTPTTTARRATTGAAPLPGAPVRRRLPRTRYSAPTQSRSDDAAYPRREDIHPCQYLELPSKIPGDVEMVAICKNIRNRQERTVHLKKGEPPGKKVLYKNVNNAKSKGKREKRTYATLPQHCELIMDFGYSCETSQATTEDGYVLDVDRVRTVSKANASMQTENAVRRNPIVLIPGMACESGIWFLNYPTQSPGFILADRGYDVWAMNTREIAFRSHHKNMSQKHDRYWQWSFDEIGRHDIAAVIDFVLNATGSRRVSLLGYSQGVMSSLVLFSTKPEYNDKVDILIGYAPAANVSHFRFPFPELFAFADPIFLLLDPLGNSGYFHLPQALRQVIQAICNMFNGEPCSLFLTLTLLSSPEQSNKTRMSVLLSHFPIGTSYQNLRHIVQNYRSKNFLMYDYGSHKNKELYGQKKPPAYPVERITVPVALFSSEGDTLGDPDDVSALVDSLGSALLFNSILPPKNFRHVDFPFSYKASAFLHGPMIDTLEEHAGTRVCLLFICRKPPTSIDPSLHHNANADFVPDHRAGHRQHDSCPGSMETTKTETTKIVAETTSMAAAAPLIVLQESRTWFENRESTLTALDLFYSGILRTFTNVVHNERAEAMLEARVQLLNETIAIFTDEMTRLFRQADPDIPEEKKI